MEANDAPYTPTSSTCLAIHWLISPPLGGIRTIGKDTVLTLIDSTVSDNMSPLGGGILGFGSLEGNLIECPRHGAKFDIRTGAVLAMPAAAPIETFPVMEKDGRIHVALKDRGGDDVVADDSW